MGILGHDRSAEQQGRIPGPEKGNPVDPETTKAIRDAENLQLSLLLILNHGGPIIDVASTHETPPRNK